MSKVSGSQIALSREAPFALPSSVSKTLPTSANTITTDFSIIEQDKENIQVLPQGRSAHMLSKTITQSTQLDRKSTLSSQRTQFENQLTPDNLLDLDDPLEPYLNYLKWIHESYPAGASSDSGLIQLLEKITHDFKDDEYYKNEIRYFKVWLEYIRFSDNPKDIFTYLHKKRIGVKLSSFYENYGKFLEAEGDFDKTESLYEQGLALDARPKGRLLKSFEEFKLRKAKFGNGSTTRRGLGTLSNPTGGGLSTIATIRKSSKSKFNIFVDGQNEEQSENKASQSPANPDGIWTHLDSMKNVKKENTPLATSWSGEKIIQTGNRQLPSKSSKFPVFNDKFKEPFVSKIIRVPGKKTEKFNFNYDLLFPDKGEEINLWELLAKTRNCYQPRTSKKRPSEEEDENSHSKSQKTESILDTTMTLQDENNTTKLLNSPTLTFFSKQAQKEVFSIINRPLIGANDDTSMNHEESTQDPMLDDGLSDFVTETLTRPVKRLSQLFKSPILPKATPPSKNNVDDDELMSSPFMDEPLNDNSFGQHVIINPLDLKLQKNLINKLSKSLSSYPEYVFTDKAFDKLALFKKLLKPNAPAVLGHPNLMIEFEEELYCFTKELGHGGYATVYLAEKPTGQAYAVKVEKPSNEWEFYILTQIASKTNGEFIKADKFIKFQDESYLILPYFSQGTILDLVNLTSTPVESLLHPKIDEQLTIYFSIQLLSQMLKLHSVGIIHGDIKPDNCMVNFSETSMNNSELTYNDIKLIDFGRSVDLSLFPPNVKFVTELDSKDNQDCPEMNMGDPWKYEPDYYGIANVMHTLLFGKFIQTKKDSNSNWVLSDPLKRYWQKDLWEELFKLLLNSNGANLSDDIKKILDQFTKWFEQNGNHATIKSKIESIMLLLSEKAKGKKKKS
ncbi:hypothetical protein CANARDRAFT_8073 [[Candida] arabinofermentans NRRL YB-2248]|uniref:Protein kinase domain-containing protein n=1 Tax=[Candida] arabinofermentans NRRL YB-2248 TaxID=983967 RepID=A0A1E4SZM6_9ASCO|nr:hypothetical protein CANARDRAFT_8073 [[Candida] arabinofermentans NRRL YB-2248]